VNKADVSTKKQYCRSHPKVSWCLVCGQSEVGLAVEMTCYVQYVWGQDVDRFIKLGNFASTT